MKFEKNDHDGNAENGKILNVILTIREQRVIVDADVAELFSLNVIDLRRLIALHEQKFSMDYVLRLTHDEIAFLVSKKLVVPEVFRDDEDCYALHEQGIVTLAQILNTNHARTQSMEISKVFAVVRNMLSTLENLKTNLLNLKEKYTQLNDTLASNEDTLEGEKKLVYPSSDRFQGKPFGGPSDRFTHFPS